MMRHPQCDNDNCEQDGGRWHHAPECPVSGDAGGGWRGEDMSLTTAREDGCTSVFVPRQQNRRAA